MAEEKIDNRRVKWMTVRIEQATTDAEVERFSFATDDDETYYVDLRPANRASELVAVSLVRDAYIHAKRVQIWYEERAGRRWVKALNVYG